jgi:hypothetical protein
MISALVIYKGEDQLPSPGFFDLAKVETSLIESDVGQMK